MGEVPSGCEAERVAPAGGSKVILSYFTNLQIHGNMIFNHRFLIKNGLHTMTTCKPYFMLGYQPYIVSATQNQN